MTPADTMRAAVEALEGLMRYAARNICMHEETKRGGVLWEICCSCGAKWADDRGGKPPYEDPAELIAAEAVLSLLRSALEGDALRRAGAAGPLGDPDVLASPLPNEVLQLLNHVEDVVGDEAWGRIDAKLWNAVTKLAAGVAIPADTSHLNCLEARRIDRAYAICEPCNTGFPERCLYKRPAPGVAPTQAPNNTDAEWVRRLRETATHLRENSLSLAKYPGMADEARARELAALYIGEIAELHQAKQALGVAIPQNGQEN